jgi:hypothetical protein
MIIYCWWCDVCDKKGATNIKPLKSDMICIECGHSLRIEAFSDIFFNI